MSNKIPNVPDTLIAHIISQLTFTGEKAKQRMVDALIAVDPIIIFNEDKTVEEDKVYDAVNDMVDDKFILEGEYDAMIQKLSQYKLVDTVDDIVDGRFVRWVNLEHAPPCKLTHGGFVVAIDSVDKGDKVVCRNRNRKISFYMKNTLRVFQKYTASEWLVLLAKEENPWAFE
jgi:hypothetical protein